MRVYCMYRNISDCGQVLAGNWFLFKGCPSSSPFLSSPLLSSPLLSSLQQVAHLHTTSSGFRGLAPRALTLDLFIIFGLLSSTHSCPFSAHRASHTSHELITSTIISSSRERQRETMEKKRMRREMDRERGNLSE